MYSEGTSLALCSHCIEIESSEEPKYFQKVAFSEFWFLLREERKGEADGGQEEAPQVQDFRSEGSSTRPSGGENHARAVRGGLADVDIDGEDGGVVRGARGGQLARPGQPPPAATHQDTGTQTRRRPSRFRPDWRRLGDRECV